MSITIDEVMDCLSRHFDIDPNNIKLEERDYHTWCEIPIGHHIFVTIRDYPILERRTDGETINETAGDNV